MHATVDVKVDVVGGPLHAESMVALGVVLATDLLGVGGLPESIRVKGRACAILLILEDQKELSQVIKYTYPSEECCSSN